MTDRELMQMALDALEAMQSYARAEKKGLRICDESIEALRERLSQPEPEPVELPVVVIDKVDVGGRCHGVLRKGADADAVIGQFLYTAPPKREWVGLTDEEIVNLTVKNSGYPTKLAADIEAKLKEKNT